LAECVTRAGKYLKVGSTTFGSVSIDTAPANWFSKGGVSVTDTTKGTNIAPNLLAASTDSSETNDIQACAVGTDTGGSSGEASCTKCVVGKYSNTAGAACTVCAANTYTDVTGSTSCTACPSISGVATVTTGTADTNHDAVQDCFADLDVTQASTIAVLEEVPGFIATANTIQFGGKLRVNVCPKGTYGKKWDLANILDAQDALRSAGAAAVTWCESTLAGYYGTQPGGAHASSVAQCPANSNSDAESTEESDCACASGYYYNRVAGCVAWPATDASTTTATTTTATTTTTAAESAAAESAGASTPIAVALAAAAAVPLLL
jgi:hypothetical protein